MVCSRFSILNKLKTVLASSQPSNNEKVKRGVFASSTMCHMLSFLSQKFISNFHVKLREKVVGIAENFIWKLQFTVHNVHAMKKNVVILRNRNI